MKAFLVTSAAVFACTLLSAAQSAADVIPSCPPGQHLVMGQGSSSHHGGGHCEPGADPNATPSAAPSSSAGSGKKSGGCSSVAAVEHPTEPGVFIGALIVPVAAIMIALRRRSRRRLA